LSGRSGDGGAIFGRWREQSIAAELFEEFAERLLRVGVLETFLELFRRNFRQSAGDESWRDAVGKILQGLAEVEEFGGGDGFGGRWGLWLRRFCGVGVGVRLWLWLRLRLWLWFGAGLLEGIAESSEEFDVDAGGGGLLFGEGQEPL